MVDFAIVLLFVLFCLLHLVVAVKRGDDDDDDDEVMMMMIIKMRLGGGEGINYESGRNSGICTNVLISLDEELMIIIYLRITQFQMSNNMISTNDERDTLTDAYL